MPPNVPNGSSSNSVTLDRAVPALNNSKLTIRVDRFRKTTPAKVISKQPATNCQMTIDNW
jgi:hypothetical protein